MDCTQVTDTVACNKTTTLISKTARNKTVRSRLQIAFKRLRARRQSRVCSIVEHQTLPQIAEGKRIANFMRAPQAMEVHGSLVEFKSTSMRVLEYHVGLQPCRYTHVQQCEEQLIAEDLNRKFRLQIDDPMAFLIPEWGPNVEDITEQIRRVPGLATHPAIMDGWLSDKILSVLYCLPMLMRCQTAPEYINTFAAAYKMLTGKHLVLAVLNRLFRTSDLQADLGDWLREARNAYEKGKEIYNGPMAERLSKMFSYLLVHGVLQRFGVPLTETQFCNLSDKKFLRTYSSVNAMWLCILETSLFVCERAFEAYQTGNVMALVQTSAAYDKWLSEAERVITLSPFTGNLEAHGTTYFSYVADVTTLIEQGEAYVTYIKNTSALDAAHMRSRLSSLKLLKATTLTRTAAQESRKAPFGILIAGGSSVAKSSFSEMIFHYYGDLFKLDTTANMRYTRCPADEYWSNFMSSMWCIQMDDVAFQLPAKTNEVDPTLKELIQVVNNVAFTPPQAALEDKGKTPVMARLCIATTNAEDLNAHEYFHCPLALRRRLPYVVNVKPKPEYLHENQRFIDPSKIPEINGAFPDLWIIEVKEVVPEMDGTRERAKLRTIEIFEHVSDFLAHFGQAAVNHERNQERGAACARQMSTLTVCPTCFRPSYDCQCELQTCGGETLFRWYRNIIEWYVRLSWVHWFMVKASHWKFFRWIIGGYVMPYMGPRQQMSFVAEVLDRIRPRQIKIGAALVAGLTVLVALYSLGCRATGMDLQSVPKQDVPVVKEEDEEEAALDTRVNIAFEKNAKENVWYQKSVELSRFDLPLASGSMSSLDESGCRDYVANNVLRLKIECPDGRVKTTGAFVIRGNIMFCNNHALDDQPFWNVTASVGECTAGITPNFKFRLEQEMVYRDAEHDLAGFQVKIMPARKDITKLWSITSFPFTKAYIVSREDDGTTALRTVHDVKTGPIRIEQLDRLVLVSQGKTSVRTEPGHCGSLWVAATPKGPVIVGFHMVGYQEQCGCSRIDVDVLTELEKRITDKKLVVSSVAPKLSLQGENPLVPLHYKSPLRYQPRGMARTYGSYSGHRPRPCSKVCPTPESDRFVAFTGIPISHGQPAMRGYGPWEKNIRKMVEPVVDFKQTDLDQCTSQFASEIIAGLRENGDIHKIVKLSWHAATNGIAGVTYIDRMNFNTSMGAPWHKTKRAYIESAPTETQPEAVRFTEEVMERARQMEAALRQGSRVYPVFTGHLKDEPTALAKCAIGKTRVFTGAPADFSLCMRRMLLTFVKVLQENILLFEACPGTTCQSKQWGVIYNHLVQHGEDRIVAGDYSAFDKKMPAAFILSAFDVICAVCEASGNWSTEDICAIRAIACDVAFPLTNMNGDLMEFYGTNPSGHPLTVIVNSLVNSLYMRYAYMQLSPERDVTHFKRDVALLTYGDDNIMGVRVGCDWFNHTTIQQTLADMGIQYTMADKESESVPFINIKECSFLKRTWRWEEELGDYACPLDFESIHKSLTMWLPSGTLPPEHQMVMVMSSANSELFFHGKEIFEKYRAEFADILAHEPYVHYVTDSTLPSWDTLKERWYRASEN